MADDRVMVKPTNLATAMPLLAIKAAKTAFVPPDAAIVVPFQSGEAAESRIGVTG
tara:strand:+ start:3878 stop:4042 length:165 start_codon:yes stop_codon:yes gene_type:complete